MIAGLNRPDTLDPTRIPAMDRLAVPARTLFLYGDYGDEDPFCPLGFVEAAAAARPESAGAVIPASGHSPLLRAGGSVQHGRASLPRRPLWGVA